MLELIPTAVTTFAAAMTANAFKGAKGPAQALDDIMTLAGFDKLNFYAEKKRANKEIYIKDYKEKIAQEIIHIPEENLQEPKLSIVGPAIEASKYYIEEDILRSMFAKLIASSMDIKKNNYIHPSYIEVIKQLSPVDAEIISTHFLRKSPQEIISLSLVSSTGQFKKTHSNLFYNTHYRNHQVLIAASIENLERLGLLEIDYTSQLSSAQYSDDYIKHSTEYKEALHQMKERNQDYYMRNAIAGKKLDSDFKYFTDIQIQRGNITMTNFGNNFCTTCL
ncbi:DUF4393 domain-containing protein [Enterococcus sp. LJL120]